MFVAEPLRYLTRLTCALALTTAACLCGSEDSTSRHEPVRELRPTSLSDTAFREGKAGDPAAIGCADGQREGFADHARFADIAGCLGSWDGKKSLRAAPTNKPCGDDKGPCAVPADVCAPGWHVCGRDGKAQDLSDRVDAEACNEGAGPGKFVAAISHGQAPVVCPPPPEEDTEFPCMAKGLCSESVCCGDDCDFGSCRDAVWLDSTKISRGTAEGCGAVTAAANGGVLCCRDEIGATPPPQAADDKAAASAGASGDGSPAPGQPQKPTPDGKPAAATKKPANAAQPTAKTPSAPEKAADKK
ncbi:MAG: hypothetical protein B7733_00465 [Myxococcales bacterium FL481]|nr:MAG: hypothetical protein B7733_00465 [Myxococcales bacterium FL481]